MATFFTSDLHLGHIHNSTTTDAYGYIKEHLPCALNAGVDSLVLKKGEVEQKKEEWEEILRREEEENAGFLL